MKCFFISYPYCLLRGCEFVAEYKDRPRGVKESRWFIFSVYQGAGGLKIDYGCTSVESYPPARFLRHVLRIEERGKRRLSLALYMR